MKITKNLLLKDWISYHPYQQADSCDLYYFDICKKVYEIIEGDSTIRKEFLSAAEAVSLTCLLVGYFEDVISQTRVWKTFTDIHEALYQKPLPFYFPVEYFNDEINREDVFFLIWYYLSVLYSGRKLFNPESPAIKTLAKKIFGIFEDEYEFAPENVRLQEFLSISPDEEDYYHIREKIQWVALDSWLFHHMREECDQKIKEQNIRILDRGLKSLRKEFSYDIIDSFTMNRYLPLFAMKGKDWLAGIIGESHPQYSNIKNLPPRKNGAFLYLDISDDFISMQHLATGKIIGVTRKSIEQDPGFKSGKTVVFAGLAKWKDEWWLSGMMSVLENKDQVVEKEKRNMESLYFFDDMTERKKEALKQQYKVFLDYNKGSSIVFLPGKESVEKFMDDWILYFTASLRLPPEEVEASRKRSESMDYGKKIDADIMNTMPGHPLLAWFNPAAGLEFVYGFNEVIPDKKNPWYKREARFAEVIYLLIADSTSADLTRFLLSSYDMPQPCFPGEGGLQLMTDNFDFILRFYKKDEYHSSPRLAMV